MLVFNKSLFLCDVMQIGLYRPIQPSRPVIIIETVFKLSFNLEHSFNKSIIYFLIQPFLLLQFTLRGTNKFKSTSICLPISTNVNQ